ncbi:MAG: type II restriction endonuclease [Candidatus Omnitrophica bacterium]|nr:type II restriction endonuclease [Candidatus Omnitrophota bacterium]
MKYLNSYKEIIGCKDKDAVFEYLLNNLKPSTLVWSYFVNWEKVFENVKEIEIGLNILNYLVGKDNFDEEFKGLLKKHPEVVRIIPALVVRDGENTKKFKILVDYKNKKLVYEDYNFDLNKLTDDDINKCLTFVKETKLKELLVGKRIKNLVDYMIGVEAGLDSNGRKNRGGTIMEDIVESFIQDICKRNGLEYLKEASANKIKEKFKVNVPVDKSSRRYDFVISNKKEIFILEVNFYSGGGSKLKATAGEYRDLANVLKGKHKFIWITDGEGWKTTSRPLRETFEQNDYLLSLDMVEKCILERIVLGNE